MNTYRTTAILVGVLYIIGTVAGVLSVVLTRSILDAPEFLLKISANETRIIMGAIFVLIMGLALALVPVLMFPVLKKQNEALALGYVVYRGALETFTYLAIVSTFLFLIIISQGYMADAVNASSWQTLGVFLIKGNDSISNITQIVFPLGALIFYSLLYQSKLIPRWITGWGLAASILCLVVSFLDLFGLINSMSPLQITLSLPIAVQEMVMAVWMIVKGFEPSAITSLSAKAAANKST